MHKLEDWGKNCDTYLLFDVMGKKWSIFIIYSIMNGYDTFNSILKEVKKINSKVLSQRLKQLEENGVIKVIINEKNMRKSYALSENGKIIASNIIELSEIKSLVNDDSYVIFDVIGKKWSIFVIYAIMNGYDTFNSISKVLKKINSKVLSQRLKQLQIHGLIDIEINEKNMRTNYILNKNGNKVAHHIHQLAQLNPNMCG